MRQTHAIIRRFFNQAMGWGWVESNPALLASPSKVVAARVVVPTVEQLISILEEAKAVHPQRGAFFMLAAITGMRRGELCALHWDDCGDTGVMVTKSVIYTPAGGTREAPTREAPTKTHQARFVALDVVGQAIIAGQKEELRGATLVTGTEFGFGSCPKPISVLLRT